MFFRRTNPYKERIIYERASICTEKKEIKHPIFYHSDPSSGLTLFDQNSLEEGDSEPNSEEEGDEVNGFCCFDFQHAMKCE